MSKVAKKGAQIRGFGRMKIEDPERFREVCQRAGRRCQKINPHVRWTKDQAKKHARAGGFARWGVTKVKL